VVEEYVPPIYLFDWLAHALQDQSFVVLKEFSLRFRSGKAFCNFGMGVEEFQNYAFISYPSIVNDCIVVLVAKITHHGSIISQLVWKISEIEQIMANLDE